MRTTPEQRAALRRAYVIVGNAGAREVAVLDDLDEALAELAALRAVAEAARGLLGVLDGGPTEGHRADTATLRAALRAWEERER